MQQLPSPSYDNRKLCFPGPGNQRKKCIFYYGCNYLPYGEIDFAGTGDLGRDKPRAPGVCFSLCLSSLSDR